MQITPNQKKALAAAFKMGGAWYGRRGSCAGGAYARMCKRMADLGLLSANAPYDITHDGLVALRDLWAKRWAIHGCEAYRLDLEAVEARLASSKAEA